ncbi:MAG: RNA polymerase sigma factor RpoH [Gammaproteobacteria bacterium]|jgi:RNA polymerase sigma-32 factor|uniref:RNA polymerase sigma factor RpoH n=1 Tax=Methyloprofundus sp. TaxID=2020875 RepID=UPI0018519E88|nr:RNA polymerase sigma factor RpoH [Methyloprofundus sp.]MBT3813143.1 RNA polymerase sigma factor RpoH [Gammaproteobacteria bacterium]HIL79603.1 RNA polymerase sigma factor RpoH [Methylococcales bacterium]MBT4146501.1 RNA polymerase sigma factor RpoH [Gammaproteobacteria bacterium]MBT5221971.1 RNA polymerase sigma factor RpoH [Gammaproteobacteria bacterium]MBT5826211.1 RNA polymerase sigma factor RpoH [Gammaproteobacteria bacterium]
MPNSLALPITLTSKNFDSYLNVVGQTNKLNAEEERALAILYRDNEDLEAAKQLVMANLRFVAHVARGYNGYGLPMNDIVQEGNIGLMKAVKRFDPNVGVRLVSFAVHWIRAEIHEYVIKNWRIVKVATTKSQRKIFFNLRKSKKQLGWLSKDEAEAIAANLDVDIKTVYEMETRLDGKDMAFDLPESSSSEESFSAPISYLQQHNADPALLLENADWQGHKETLLSNALQGLDERSQDIVASRWLTEKKMTLHELAERYGVSAERIRQLEKNAMKKLKGAVSIAA